MAREIAGKDQRKGKKEREDLGFGAGNSCSNRQRMEFYHCVLLFVCLFVCLLIYLLDKKEKISETDKLGKNDTNKLQC